MESTECSNFIPNLLNHTLSMTHENVSAKMIMTTTTTSKRRDSEQTSVESPLSGLGDETGVGRVRNVPVERGGHW